MRLTLLAALLVGASLAGCTLPDQGEVVSLDTGTIQYPGEKPEAIRLPDYWWPERRIQHDEATYRFPVHLETAPDQVWAVYLSRLAMNAAVYVNGEFVGDGGRLERPLARNANRPLFFTIPTGMLHAGDNTIQVRLLIETTFPGILDPVEIGPKAALSPRYNRQHLFQVTVPQAVAITSFAVALLIFGVFAGRDPEGANAWFAVALALWSVTLATGFMRDVPMPARVWEFIAVASQAGVVYGLIRAFHLRIFGRRLVRRERILAAILGVPGIVTALVDQKYAFTSWIVWQVITGSVAVYVFLLIYHATKRGLITHPRTLVVASFIGAIFVAHDLASVFYGGPLSGYWLSAYAASVALLFSGWSILVSLADSLTEAETLNRELEGRVKEKHAELETNYQKLRALERERAIADERERIMQDVHDGIGGQLVSTLALVESGRGESEVVADSLHEALDDLRLIIDSLDPDEGDLAAVLGTMRLRLQPRLERNGIEIDWQVQDVPPIEGFGPEQALQVLRIVQESIANVLKHAAANRVCLRTGTHTENGRREAFVEIEDDGSGMVDGAPPGRGLANMHRRAASLGGTLEITSSAAGTRVRLGLPL